MGSVLRGEKVNFYDDGDSAALVRLEINTDLKVLSIAGEVSLVVRSFDGKILNKRLDTALKKIDRNLYVDSMYSSSLGINYYTGGFSIPSVNNPSTSLYLNSRYKTLCFCAKRSENGKGCVSSEGRLISKPVIESISEYSEHLRRSITELESKKDLIEVYRSCIKTVEQDLKALQEEIPFAIKRYYDLGKYIM